MSDDLTRRQFHVLTSAALGGLVAGATLGCGTPAAQSTASAQGGDKHLCRGLNECKGQGAGGKNDCRGQGDCASAAVRHDCATMNTCKGLGGCGETAGANDCSGKGGCHVPLMEGAWKTVRTRLETKWSTAKTPFADAPAEQKM
ncbi:MAG TPA: hypothetical protein VL096_00090 [Pirellulaceae bacterium]|nr:hypothetical protein [Pirellulaceae bacterium]